MLDKAWGQAIKMGEVPQPLKSFEEYHPTKRRHGRLRHTVDERQVLRGRRVECFELLVNEVRTNPRIRRLMDRRHGGVPPCEPCRKYTLRTPLVRGRQRLASAAIPCKNRCQKQRANC